MRAIRRLLAVVVLSASMAVLGLAPVACKSGGSAQSDSMTTYKCAMSGCNKSKQAKAGDPAPS
jgi:hypothetical protein